MAISLYDAAVTLKTTHKDEDANHQAACAALEEVLDRFIHESPSGLFTYRMETTSPELRQYILEFGVDKVTVVTLGVQDVTYLANGLTGAPACSSETFDQFITRVAGFVEDYLP